MSGMDYFTHVGTLSLTTGNSPKCPRTEYKQQGKKQGLCHFITVLTSTQKSFIQR